MGKLSNKLENIRNVKKTLQDVFFINENIPIADYPDRISNNETVTLGILNEDKNFQEVAFDGTIGVVQEDVEEINELKSFNYDADGVIVKEPLTGTDTTTKNKLQNIVNTKGALKQKFDISDDVTLRDYPSTIGTGDTVVLGYVTEDKKFQPAIFDGNTAVPRGTAEDVANVYEHRYAFPPEEFFGLTFTAETHGVEISFRPTYGVELCAATYYRRPTDIEWKLYNPRETIFLENIGDQVYFKRDWFDDGDEFVKFDVFSATEPVAASGNIMSMLGDAENLTRACFCYMFSGCIELTTAPELPATVLEDSCYKGMFIGCWSLTTAPELPATVLADSCYKGMFIMSGIKSIKIMATNLSDDCFRSMFEMCNELNSIEVHFTEWMRNDMVESPFMGWVLGVYPSGTFYKPSALPEQYGVDYIPKNWTVANID